MYYHSFYFKVYPNASIPIIYARVTSSLAKAFTTMVESPSTITQSMPAVAEPGI